MDTIGEIKYEIKMLSKCFEKLEEAYKCLLDVDDTDEIFTQIVDIAEKVNDLKIKKEIELESMVV